MADLTRAEAVRMLRELGWRVRTDGEYPQVVRNFQRGWNFGAGLEIDGVVGRFTSAALRESRSRLSSNLPTASAHFSFTEFRCNCGGRYPECQRIWVLRPLLVSLETLRNRFYRDGLAITSGCRCTQHNRAVGGASRSQHLFGAAADMPYAATAAAVSSMRVFAGIGRSARTSLVRHADRRDVSGRNTTGASLARPTIWDYAS